MPSYNVGNVEVGIRAQAESGIKTLETASQKCNQVAKSIDTINKKINETGKQSNNTAKSSEKMQKKLSEVLSLNRIYFLYNYTKRMAQGVANIIQESIDYQETLNKFQNSMGNMYNNAVKFQNKISEAYSLSSKSLMEYQANFNNMLKGLGQMDESISYKMSEALVEMGTDISSLFNIDVDSAMTKLQAALAQQTRPIRNVTGFDITQNTLQNVMSQIGMGDRAVSQLSQVEKRLLIIITLQKQMANTNTFGDWARTMNQPANQLRILKEQLIDLKVVLGSFTLGALRNILPYVNAIVMVIKELLKMGAALFGIETEISDYSFDIELGDEGESAAAGVDKATKAVEKLKKATTGIDELNILSYDTGDSGAGDTGTGDVGLSGGVDSRLLAALADYNSQLDKVNNKATSIRDRIMEWLGFTKEVNAETGEISWVKGEGVTNLDKIITALKIIGVIITGTIIGKGLNGIRKGLDGAVGAVNTLLGLVGAGKLKTLTEIFTKGLSTSNLAKSIEQIRTAVGLVPKTFEDALVKVPMLIDGIVQLFLSVLQIVGGLALVVGGIVLTISGIHDLLDGDVTNDFNAVMSLVAGIALIVAGIAVLLGAWPVAIIAGIVAVVALVIKYRDKIAAFFTETLPYYVGYALGWIKNKAVELGDKIKTYFEVTLPEKLRDLKDKVIAFFTDGNLLDNIKELGRHIKESILSGFKKAFEKVVKVFKKIGSFFSAGFDAGSEGRAADLQGTIDSLDTYATGGFPTRGDYFIANEKGPEYVGSIGNRSAVANTQQIVQGISYGVSMAQSEQNALLRAQNTLLQKILAKGSDVYMDGRKVTDVLQQSQNNRGANAFVGDFQYV